MTKEIQSGIENWRIELENKINNLKGEYDDCVRKIKITNAKISISSQAMNRVGFGSRSEFEEKFIDPLENELDRLEIQLEKADEKYSNEKKFLALLVESIDSAYPPKIS